MGERGLLPWFDDSTRQAKHGGCYLPDIPVCALGVRKVAFVGVAKHDANRVKKAVSLPVSTGGQKGGFSRAWIRAFDIQPRQDLIMLEIEGEEASTPREGRRGDKTIWNV